MELYYIEINYEKNMARVSKKGVSHKHWILRKDVYKYGKFF